MQQLQNRADTIVYFDLVMYTRRVEYSITDGINHLPLRDAGGPDQVWTFGTDVCHPIL